MYKAYKIQPGPIQRVLCECVLVINCLLDKYLFYSEATIPHNLVQKFRKHSSLAIYLIFFSKLIVNTWFKHSTIEAKQYLILWLLKQPQLWTIRADLPIPLPLSALFLHFTYISTFSSLEWRPLRYCVWWTDVCMLQHRSAKPNTSSIGHFAQRFLLEDSDYLWSKF